MAKTPSAAEKEDAAAAKALKIAAYPAAAVTGYYFTQPLIRNATYDNLKYSNAFEDIRPAHNARLKEVIERFRQGKPVDVLNETRKLHETYEAQLSQRFKAMGLGSTAEQWRFIHKSQKQNALMTGATAAAVALGVVLTVANSKAFSEALMRRFAGSENEERTP